MIWDKFIGGLNQSQSFRKLCQLYESGHRLFGLTGPCEAGKALALAGLYSRRPRAILWITPSDEEAERQRDNLEVLLGPEPVRWWAAWDILPGDQREPDVELVGSRMECLQAQAGRRPTVILASARSVVQRTLAPAEFAARRMELAVGLRVDRDELLARLVNSGYQRQPVVSGIGEFSLRGSIIDIAGYGQDGPLRLELEDEIGRASCRERV